MTARDHFEDELRALVAKHDQAVSAREMRGVLAGVDADLVRDVATEERAYGQRRDARLAAEGARADRARAAAAVAPGEHDFSASKGRCRACDLAYDWSTAHSPCPGGAKETDGEPPQPPQSTTNGKQQKGSFTMPWMQAKPVK